MREDEKIEKELTRDEWIAYECKRNGLHVDS